MVVKGISRRVIVVRSPDPRFFEQAIFLLKEDALHADGVTAEQVVKEARQAAAGYVERTTGKTRKYRGYTMPGWVWFVLGACAVGLLWWIASAV